jgi:hypothetical protein
VNTNSEEFKRQVLGLIAETAANPAGYEYLLRIIALEQSDYAYDPCGKSWNELNPFLTDLSRAAVKRAHFLLEGEELRG